GAEDAQATIVVASTVVPSVRRSMHLKGRMSPRLASVGLPVEASASESTSTLATIGGVTVKQTDLLTPSYEAVMVTVPGLTPSIPPAVRESPLSTTAMFVSLDVQTTSDT